MFAQFVIRNYELKDHHGQTGKNGALLKTVKDILKIGVIFNLTKALSRPDRAERIRTGRLAGCFMGVDIKG